MDFRRRMMNGAPKMDANYRHFVLGHNNKFVEFKTAGVYQLDYKEYSIIANVQINNVIEWVKINSRSRGIIEEGEYRHPSGKAQFDLKPGLLGVVKHETKSAAEAGNRSKPQDTEKSKD